MADLTTLRRSPLEHLSDRLRTAAVSGNRAVSVREVPFLTMVSVRVQPGSAAAARMGDFLGAPLPQTVGEVSAAGALWLGPDEWLVTVPEGAVPELPTRIARATADLRAAVTDLSASRAIIEVAGPRARELLQKGCGLDLHPRAFGPGQCAQTLFARLPVIIDQLSAAPSYRLYVRRSSARWLYDWLIDAAEEFRAG
jgi:sarcosine oxidase subunit gamma